MPFQDHPIAALFPMMSEEEFKAFKEDIREHGLQEPITMYEDKVLDGRNRARACFELNIKPKTRQFDGADPIAFVVSLNKHRRHLSQTQWTMVGARIRPMYDEYAKARQRAGQERGRQSQKGIVENLPHTKLSARDQAGKAVGVSGKSIDYATKVLNQGTPLLIEAVDKDRLAVSTASRVASLSEEEQNALAERALANGNKPKFRPNTELEPDEEDAGEITVKGVGIVRAHEAINCLMRIPKNDALRKRGFQVVTDWIKHNR